VSTQREQDRSSRAFLHGPTSSRPVRRYGCGSWLATSSLPSGVLLMTDCTLTVLRPSVRPTISDSDLIEREESPRAPAIMMHRQRPTTGVGARAWSNVPLPSWPFSLPPQHSTLPSRLTAQVKS